MLKVFRRPYFDFFACGCLKKKLAMTMRIHNNTKAPIAAYIRMGLKSFVKFCGGSEAKGAKFVEVSSL